MAKHPDGNSRNAQQSRLMAALKRGPVSTITARSELDIMMPAARVHELRHDGANILTHWTTENTEAGNAHRVARYVLLSEGTQHD